MLRAERQAQILQIVREKGSIRNEELIKLLATSHVTIRRDLVSLAKQNLVKLEHGGATSIDFLEGMPEPLYDTKLFVHQEEKNAIARQAASLVKNADILFLDSGTTNFRIAKILKTQNLSKVTVITTDFMIAKELSNHTSITTLLIGGIVRHSYYNTHGPYAEMILSNLKANKFFLGFDGASITRGYSNTVLEEVPIKQKMIEACDQVYAVGDSSKYGIDAPYAICGWDKVQHAIIDEKISPAFITYLGEKGVNFIPAVQ